MDQSALPPIDINLFGYLLPFLVILTLIVFIHELGHFLVGRWNGVKAEVFSIGFGPELFGFTDRYETRWRFSLIPLGGYVKFFGDANAASATDFEQAGQMSEAERAISFPHKSVGQRAAIVVAGPLFNFILSILIFTATYMSVGRYVNTPLVSEVLPNSAAAAAGLQKGDHILAINGTKIEAFFEISRMVAPNPGREMIFTLKRDGRQMDIALTPRFFEQTDRFGNTNTIGLVGISNSAKDAPGEYIKTGLFSSLWLAIKECWIIVSTSLLYLWDVITGHQSADQLGGPLRIAKTSGEVATFGIGALVNFAALLSVAIGMLNLFPIPMLDGGHLVFYAIEALRGRPLSQRSQEIGLSIGLALVLMLMVFVTWNDITRIFLS